MTAAMGEDVERREALDFIPLCTVTNTVTDRICHPVTGDHGTRQIFAGHPNNVVPGSWTTYLQTKFHKKTFRSYYSRPRRNAVVLQMPAVTRNRQICVAFSFSDVWKH